MTISDNIDVASCEAAQIAVVPATGANSLPVAEYVLATAMVLLRGAYLVKRDGPGSFDFHLGGVLKLPTADEEKGLGTGELLDRVVGALPTALPGETHSDAELRVAIVGKPNVGKSSLLNALVGEPRALVADEPGTTRDAIDSRLRWHGHAIDLIDTAGLRRRARVEDAVDVFAAIRTMRSIERADVCLLLLDATGAYDRDVKRQMGGSGMHFTTPMMQLQDAKQTKVLIATLAETTPVLEAANLQSDLRRAGIEPWAWVINNSVAAVQSSSPLLRQRAINELAQIDLVAHTHAVRYAVVPLIQDEPVGVERLRALANCHPVTA